MTSSIGPVDRLLLIGGGALLPKVARIGQEAGLKVYVLTSPRHTEANAENFEFAQFLESTDITWESAVNFNEGLDKFGQDFSLGSFNLSLSNPWIMKGPQIEKLFGGNLFNCHGTRLPLDRGAGGFSWQIMQGNRYGIVNLYLMDEGVDTGPVVEFEEFIFPMSCRIPRDFQTVYARKLLGFLKKRIQKLANGEWKFKKSSQPEYTSTYWPRLNSDVNSWINWSNSCENIYRFICAFDAPYGGAKTQWKKGEVVIRDVLANFSDGSFHPFQSGLVYRKSRDWLSVATNDGNLIVSDVRRVDGTNIFRDIEVGDRFYTEPNKSGESMGRARLGPTGWKT